MAELHPHKGYGWRRDTPDFRDRRLQVMHPGPLPAKVDLRETGFFDFPIYDQGALGSCTANAIAAGIMFAQTKEGPADPHPVHPSRLQIYYFERVLEDSVEYDSGAEIRDGLKVAAKLGYSDESLWPYVIERFADKPPDPDPAEHVYSYYRLSSGKPAEMKLAIALGFPVIFGFSVYSSFGPETPMPAPTDSLEGGHAVIAVAYDDATKRYTVRNSWGSDWGLAGHFTLPYDYVANPDLASDLWVIRAET